MKRKGDLLKNESEQKKAVIVCGILAYLSTHTISRLMDLRGGIVFSWSFFTLMVWGGLWVLFYLTWQGWKREDAGADATGGFRRRRIFTSGLSGVLGICLTAGYQLQWIGYTEPGFRGKFRLLLYGVAMGLAILPFCDKGFALLTKWTEGQIASRRSDERSRIFLCSFLGIWLCWIPVWLAYYPVIMSYDFHKQSLNALLGPQYFDAHHPLAHTWLIYVFRNIGVRIGSFETAFGWFSLLQQFVSALVLGYACTMIYRLTKSRLVVVLSALFFGIFPLISVMVMCTSKDVLFGAFFVLFLLQWTEYVLYGASGQRRLLQIVTVVVSGVFMMLFRNNAWYAMIPFAVICLFFGEKKRRVRAALLALLLVVLGKGALVGILHVLDSYEGSKLEKYSVIYQSMARVGNRQRDNLTPEDFALLDTYVGEACWADYNPPLADTVKAHVNRDNYYERKSWDDMGVVFAAWVKLGLHYPNEYIDAFLDLTRGYWFMDDVSHAEMLGVGTEGRMGLLYTYNTAAEESLPGMQHISKFPWLEEKLEQIVSANCYTDWPVVSNLFKPALWCWLLVIAVVWFWYRRDGKKAGILMYPLCYFGTMLLGPTAIIRYVYPFILMAPLVIALVWEDRA
ncbi:MAG: hypothetical protein IJ794_17030 [Lachnospiraceae bacterium]|nr:hypothetical protein [Lachnospiraceae bacterium]